MQRFFQFKVLVGVLIIIIFSCAGYIGYLSALVDLDEQQYLQQVTDATDKSRLEKQLARTKSILVARSLAYIRRSQDFIRQKQGTTAATPSSVPALQEKATVPEVNQAITTLEQSKVPLDQNQTTTLTSLKEEQKDLAFFQDEVGVIQQTLDREKNDQELAVFLASDRQRRSISDSLRQLLQLLDKQKQLAEQRKVALTTYDYWEKNPKSAPSSIGITVSNKDQVQRTLNPIHVTQISTALSIMPAGFDKRLKNIYIVYGDDKMRRGMTGIGVTFLKGEELDFFRVMIHEFGHVWDLYREVNDGDKSQFYDGDYRIYQADPSVTYYSYSWKSNTERTSDANGYASTYGMTDPFEDFAEAFALYTLQNNTFVSWKESNSVMANKYQFLNNIYGGRVFNSSDAYKTQPYDVTLMYVDYSQLLQTGG